jgi:hypothetical protein
MALSDRLREMKNNQMLTTLGQQQGIVPPQPASLGNTGGGQGVVQETETAMPMPIQTEKKTIVGKILQQEGLINPLLHTAVEKAVGEDTKKRAEAKQKEDDKIVEAAQIRKNIVENSLPMMGGLPRTAQRNINAALENQDLAAKSGGLMEMAAGGFMGQVPGRGHGMQDNVYMPIVERQAGQQIGTLAVSPDEYVVDAHTMSALGNGSADAGARVMDKVVKGVRQKAFGTDKQPNEISGLAALRPMIERA